jgi:glycerol-3-phosphate dehydrogenase
MEGRLGPQERVASLAELASTELDVLVVGGGVVGAAAALDAVTRGLSVGLIEGGDWASGSSSRSSMLINGGLSHLDAFQLGRMREQVRERALLFDRIAPHLVQRVPFLFPLHHSAWDRALVGAGLKLYEAMGHSLAPVRGMPSHRHLSRRSVRRIAPGLRRDLAGGVQYYGAQVDDARFVVTLVRTAASYGALVASRVRAESILVVGDRVAGVSARDCESRQQVEIKAKVVVAATGLEGEELVRSAGVEPGTDVLSATKGVHLVVPRDRIRSSTGVISRSKDSLLLVMPWGRHWIVGRTQSPWELDGQAPVPSSDDIDLLLADVNQVLARPLSQADVQGSYAGLWPQLAPGGRGGIPSTTRGRWPSSGGHRVSSPVAGLVRVQGGNLSRYRLMAVETIDAAARALGGLVAESITDQVPLLGADGYQARWNQRHLLARRAGLHVARVEHLLNRYGSQVDQLLELVADRPELRLPVAGAEDYLAVEVVYAASHEGATELIDLLARRTRIAIETWDGGQRAAPHAAGLMGPVLGWDDAQAEDQVARYERRRARGEL